MDAASCYENGVRRFPAPWTVEAIEGGFKVVEANKQVVAYVYGCADKRDAEISKSDDT